MNTKLAILLLAGLVVAGVALHNRFRCAERVPSADQTAPVSTRSLPAPRMAAQASPVEAPAENPQPTNALARLFKNEGEQPKPSRHQVESYLTQNRRSAESLVAAFRLAGDRSLLQEAVEKHPNEPRVNFAGWSAAQMEKDASPEERRQWLDALKRSAPDNALANYLSAQDYVKSGQTDRAVEELIAAAGKSKFQDYSADYVQNVEEAYLAAGCSEAEAKAAAAYAVVLPQLSEMRRLSESLPNLAALYRQAGDEPSAQAILQMGLDLGRRLEESAGGSLMTQDLVGLAIQRGILRALEPGAQYGNTGQTVQNELDTLTQRLQSLKALWKQAEPILQNMPDQELIRYFDRMKTFGETTALLWVMNRSGGL
jgi:tetratricopeptide (TPR) repeat protein